MWSKPLVSFKDPGLEPSTLSEGSCEKDVGFLRKGRRHNRTVIDPSLKTKTRENVKFRPLDDDDSADSDVEVGYDSDRDARRVNLRPWLSGTDSTPSTRSSTPTVLEKDTHSHVDDGKDSHHEVGSVRLSTGPEVSDLPDYSDDEVDIASDVRPAKCDPNWTPRFLQSKLQLPKPQPDNPRTPPLDQILSPTGRPGPLQKDPKAPLEKRGSPRWQAFWRDVDEKIQRKVYEPMT